jgi:hypothetical protein
MTCSIRSRSISWAADFACRTERENETPSEGEGNAERGVADDEVGRRFRPHQLLHAVRDRHRSTGHERPERREQRPDIGLSPVTKGMRIVRSTARPPVGDEQEDLVVLSAQECDASASIDADPVTVAATVFATATSALAAKATRTVLTLVEEAAAAARASRESDVHASPSPPPPVDASAVCRIRSVIPPSFICEVLRSRTLAQGRTGGHHTFRAVQVPK